MDRLLEHQKYKNAAEMLQQKRMIEEAAWSNPQMQEFLAAGDDPGLAVTLFDLVKTFQTVLDRAKNRPNYEVDKDDVTVPIGSVVRGTHHSHRSPVSARIIRKHEERAICACFWLSWNCNKGRCSRPEGRLRDIFVKRSASVVRRIVPISHCGVEQEDS